MRLSVLQLAHTRFLLFSVSSVDSYTEVSSRRNRIKTIKQQYEHEEVTSGSFSLLRGSENNSSVYILSVLLPEKRADVQNLPQILSCTHACIKLVESGTLSLKCLFRPIIIPFGIKRHDLLVCYAAVREIVFLLLGHRQTALIFMT